MVRPFFSLFSFLRFWALVRHVYARSSACAGRSGCFSFSTRRAFLLSPRARAASSARCSARKAAQKASWGPAPAPCARRQHAKLPSAGSIFLVWRPVFRNFRYTCRVSASFSNVCAIFEGITVDVLQRTNEKKATIVKKNHTLF